MQKTIAFIAIMLTFIFQAHLQSPGNALNFDGANDMVVSATVPPLFNTLAANDFTFEAWVYPSASAFQRIIFAQPSTANFATMGTGIGNVIYFYVIAGGTTYSVVTSASIPTNQWTHVAARWTSSTLTPQVFFNGVLQASAAGGGSSSGTSGLMTIGTRPGGFQYFTGSLDEVRVWSEARTQCQIMSNMNAEFTAPVPNLVAYYNFNQGIASGSNPGVTTLPDINATYNGTLNNFALSGGTSNWIASGAVINQVGPNTTFSSSSSSTICQGDTAFIGSQPYTITGIHSDTLLSMGGCDSVVTLNLTVNNSSGTNFSVTACDQYMFNSTLLTSSGIYEDTLSSASGCDSIVTLNLTIHNTQSTVIPQTACDQYLFNSVLLTSSGTYYDTLNTINGCDSLITLNLTIHQSASTVISPTACNEYLFNSVLLTTSGTYYDTLGTINGCDSIITLNLTINNANTAVIQTGNVLTSSASGATYQWLDCNNNFAIIPGETNAVFNTTMNGDYAVQVTQNGCTDTSACYNVNTFGMDASGEMVWNIYPNPTDDIIHIQTNYSESIENIRLVNIYGEILLSFNLEKDQLATISLYTYPAGIYFVYATVNGSRSVKRILKK